MKLAFRARLAHWLVRLTSQTLNRDKIAQSPALVLVPHPDDETLGCGGTIILKRNYDTAVKIVYMTDGAGSNHDLEMAAIRKTEALNACKTLGVKAENIDFLDFPDGDLSSHHSTAIERILRILQSCKGYEIFVPANGDGHPDHQATTEILLAALGAETAARTTYQYPVWRWNQYPFVEEEGCGLRCKIRLLKNFTHYFLLQRTVKVPVSGQLKQKRQALSQHVSQMTKEYDSDTTTLTEIGGGNWLNLLLSDFEVFKGH